MKGLIVFLVFVSLLTSCKKAEDRACFKGVGEELTREVEVESFQTLFLGSHIEFVLVQDTVEKVVLTGGENLLNFIGLNIVDGELRVTNDNKCNFLRTYKKSITAEIHLVDITQIEYEGTTPLVCSNQLTCPSLLILIKEGAGEFGLKINNDVLLTNISNGWGNIKISGTTKYAKLEAFSNGFIDAYDLNVLDSMHVISKTPGTMKVNANNALLRSETSSKGDIWYIGTPTLIDHNQYGTGELIDKN